LFVDASIGSPQVDNSFNRAMFGSGANGDWNIDLSKNLHVSFSNDIFFLGATFTSLQPDYRSQPGDTIVVVKDVFVVDDFVPGRGKVERPQEGYYTQVRYPLSDDVNLFARWERFYRNAHDKNQSEPRPFPAPLWAEITTSVSFGASYQLNRNWQIAAEIHSVNGSAWLPPFFITTPEATESKDWTLSALQISYRF
jgi:hypothetical protein